MPVIFANARTAFWYGLQQLPIELGQTMLVPDYICEVVMHPLEDLGIRILFYPVNDSFFPDWNVLETLQSSESVHAFLLVHYFGQPQDIERARKFCDRHRLWLIEDNAHGHGGTLNGQPLGSFGDMGFSSPRKQLQSSSGGMLYLHGKHVESTKDPIPVYPVSKSKELLHQIIRPFPLLKGMLRQVFMVEPDYADPSAFSEIRMGYHKSDPVSTRRILTENWTVHATSRRESWNAWSRFASEQGLEPVWKEPHPESCPWVIPVYASSPEDRLRLLRWSRSKGLDFFPWPTMPEEVMRSLPSARNRWQHLFCIPLNNKPC